VSASSRPHWIRDLLLLNLPHVSVAASRFWTVAAIASLVVSMAAAFLPGQLHDFAEVRGWIVAWLVEGRNPYTDPALDVDYPPSAFLILAPLGLFSPTTGAVLCMVANAIAMVLAHWLLLRWINERIGSPLSPALVRTLTALALCAGAARAATWQGQTMPLGMLLGVLALRASATRPLVAAGWLGLAAFKPHIALAFGLGILLTRGLAIPLLSLLAFVASCLLFAPTVDRTTAELIGDFFHNISRMYGEGGHTTATTAIDALELILGATGGVALHALLALVSLAGIGWAAWRGRGNQHAAVWIVTAGLMWSLVFLPNQRYSAMLAAPVWWLLLIPGAGLVRRERVRLAIAAGVTIYSVLDVQLLVRLAARGGALLSDAPAWTSLMQTIYDSMIAESGASPLRFIMAGGLCLVWKAMSRGTEEFSTVARS